MIYDKIILGENVEFSTDCDKTGCNNNILVCASSGAGKTMSIIEPRLLETYNSSLVVTVTKRKIVDKYKKLFVKRGYRVLDMNFSSPNQNGVCFDLLDNIRTDTDIAYLAQSIVMANPAKKNSNADPYWDMIATSLLTAIIGYVVMSSPKCSFNQVLEIIDKLNVIGGDNGITTTIDNEMEAVCLAAPHSITATCWLTFRVLSLKTAGCAYSTLTTALTALFPQEIRKMFNNGKKLDISSIGTEKTVLFVTSSPVNPALNCLINIFYARLFKELFEFAEGQQSKKLPIPVGFLCDDFATGGKILNFSEYIAIIREKGISTTILVQSESQLQAIYGQNDAKNIINNCDTYVFMGGMDLTTCKNISERLNRPLEDVLYMPVGKEFIFRRGQKPIETNRYDVRSNAIYTALDEEKTRDTLVRRFAANFR